uniref:Myosin motor domain-containing protein n=1 Tax=Timema shepardi TaxID=629360 RepID=A0A7R9G6N5_TIMSH|nr:unnamed protein product [Timema shepardi]
MGERVKSPLAHPSLTFSPCSCAPELVLKQEQEEYQREGIEWRNIEYFNNQIICDLVEEPHKGMLAIVDEACLNVGKVTDETVLTRLLHPTLICPSVSSPHTAPPSHSPLAPPSHSPLVPPPTAPPSHSPLAPPRLFSHGSSLPLSTGSSSHGSSLPLSTGSSSTVFTRLLSTHQYRGASQSVVCCQLLLEAMDKKLSHHEHYTSRQLKPLDKLLKHKVEFRIRHYAGDVVYNIYGFLDKNKDTLFQDFKRLLYHSSDKLISNMWPEGSMDITKTTKRPQTAGSLFRSSMIALVKTLTSKEPFYVRCIKPNEVKSPIVFDAERVEHQVRYLGLVENVRVRRAGFAHRQRYDRFLKR